MKILMLNPPFLPNYSRGSRSPCVPKGGTLYYPIWLSYATGVLENEGFKVKLIDAPARGLDEEDIKKIVKQFNPNLIVIDTSTPSIYNDVKVGKTIKEITDSFVILVGMHPSALPEQTLKISEKIDAVARHEYDYTIRDLASTLESEKKLETVKGITFRNNGEIIPNQDRPFIENLDEIPFVSEVYKKHLRIEDYFYSANLHPVITILSGRGCVYRCAFCVWPEVFSGHKYRFRSVKNVVDELEYIKNEFPQVKEIFLEDDTLTVNLKRCRELSDLIVKRKLDITFSCNSRAEADFITLKKLKEAGCRLFCVGFESGVQRILDNIHKRITIKKIKQFMKDAKKAGILVHGCFILGMPGDTKETVMKTIEFAKELNPDTAQFFPLMVYPGTEAYEWAKKNGYLVTEDFSKWLTAEGQHNTLVSRPGLSNRELVELCDQARREFFLRPDYIFYKIRQMITKPKESKRTFKSAKTFFKFLFRGSLSEHECGTCQ